MVLDVLHPGRPNVSKEDLRDRLKSMYDVKDASQIVVFGMRTAFGGGKSSGFALAYDSLEALKRFEPKYRVARQGLGKHTRKSRKQLKERKNKNLKVRGKAKKSLAA